MVLTSIPILITATFDVGETPQVALSKFEDRVEKYMEGFIAWLRDPLAKKIVFAKNCTCKLRSKILEVAASSYGKELEFLDLQPSAITAIRGKGYGEGDLISQALKSSELLGEAEEFIKVTGKLYAPQLEQLFTSGHDGEFLVSLGNQTGKQRPHTDLLSSMYKSEAGCSLLDFLRRQLRIPWRLVSSPAIGWIDTRVFRVRRDFYQKVLLNSYRRVNDSLGYTLEAAFYDDLINQNGIYLIKQLPIILGTSGTLGTTAGEYAPDLKKEAAELAKHLIF